MLEVEKQHPDAVGSLREGLDELFTVTGIGLTPARRRCLGTTNVIGQRALGHAPPHGPRDTVERRVDGGECRVAASFLDAEKGYRRIMGYRELWTVKAAPGRARVGRIVLRCVCLWMLLRRLCCRDRFYVTVDRGVNLVLPSPDFSHA